MMIIIILVGFFLRVYHLAAVPLRGDEAFTVQYWAGQPLSESLAKTATTEPHPVLTYGLFRGWGFLAGTSEFTMRLLPALSNVLGIAALYALGRLLGGNAIGLLAALLFALHPFEIWHAQDARNYAIWAGTSAVTLALGLRALHTNQKRHWFLYALATAITNNIFYFEWLTIAAFGLYVFIVYWKNKQKIIYWLAAVLPAILTSVTSFLLLQGSLIATGTYSGTTASRLDLPRLLTWFLPSLNFGETLPLNFVSAIWPFLLLALIVGLVITWQKNRLTGIFLTSLALIPMLMLAIGATRLNIFDPRYILTAVPAYILIIASLTVDLNSRIYSRIPTKIIYGFSAALMVLWVGVGAYSLYNADFVPDYAKSKDWPALTQYLSQHVTHADLVVQLSVDPAFGYYYHASADAPALPERPSQPANDIRQILQNDSARYRSIWIVGQTFPDWPNVGVVENWLDTNMQRVNSGDLDGLNFRQFMNWQVQSDEIQRQPLATFGDVIQLVGTQVTAPAFPGDNLTVWLYWKPLKTTDKPLKVFVHLLGSMNPETGTPLWTQADHFPQDGRTGTTNWIPGTIYRDIYTLPVSTVPAGNYSLETGFYDPDSNVRLPVGNTDSYSIQAVTLK